jgi:hypothetical protein
MIVISVTAFIKKADLIRLPTYIDQCPIVEALLKNNSTTEDLLSEFDMTTTEQSFMDFTTTESSIALALMDDDG